MGQEISRLLCSAETVAFSELGNRRRSRQFMFVEEVTVPSTLHGESPHWCSISKSLFYIDIAAKTVYRYIPSTKTTESMLMNSAVGFAVPTSQTTASKVILFIGLEAEIVEVNFTTKEILRVVSILPENISLDCRFNDGKCNNEGRLYTGYMNTKWRDGKRGNVYQLIQLQPETSDAVMGLQPMFDDKEFHLPNGSAWGNDGSSFFIDSGNNTIMSYSEVSITSDGSHGAYVLERKSLIYTLNQDDHSFGYMLDGMTIDKDGKLWVALVGASCLIRINPDDGKEIMRLRLPIKKPTACTFGGPTLSDLYITSRDDGTSAQPNGKLYIARLDGIFGLSAGIPIAVPKEEGNFFTSLFQNLF